MQRSLLRSEVERRLGKRDLVWAGIRGADIEPLADLPQLSASFSILSSYDRRASVDGVAYEDLTGVRVDPEVWDIDGHLGDEATKDFRRGLLRALSGESALLPYRPSNFLSSIAFARRGRCTNLGMFGAHQSAFEHKPWVETSIAAEGVPHIPWRYIADEEQLATASLFHDQPVVLRRSRTSGGEGMFRAQSADEIGELWPRGSDGYVSVGPYIENALPVNVGATVWKKGVTVHHPSVQLIGIPGLVTREFGYAGNDFGAMRDVDPVLIDEIESSTVTIGKWLRTNGYLGSFGVDYLIHDGHALFTEVNARFQGSTAVSCRLSIAAGESDLMLEHVAAWLKVEAPGQRPLRDIVAETPDAAQLIMHSDADESMRLNTTALEDALDELSVHGRVELLPGADIRCDPGSAIARWIVDARLTETGYALLPQFADIGTGLLHGSTEKESA